jgi:hypothetical protein
MSEQTIVILVVITGLFAMPFLGGWMSHRMKLSAERAAGQQQQVRELAERVQMLERVVTDRGYDVATQIEALRARERAETVEALPERSAG